jgi:hypothetical protein
MSSYVVFLPVALVASLLLQMGDLGDLLTRTVVDLAFLRPGSRKQEVSDAGPLNISSSSRN